MPIELTYAKVDVGSTAAWPLAASAQQRSTMPMVEVLFGGSSETTGDEMAGLLRGMSETGFVEGRSVTV